MIAFRTVSRSVQLWAVVAGRSTTFFHFNHWAQNISEIHPGPVGTEVKSAWSFTPTLDWHKDVFISVTIQADCDSARRKQLQGLQLELFRLWRDAVQWRLDRQHPAHLKCHSPSTAGGSVSTLGLQVQAAGRPLKLDTWHPLWGGRVSNHFAANPDYTCCLGMLFAQPTQNVFVLSFLHFCTRMTETTNASTILVECDLGRDQLKITVCMGRQCWNVVQTLFTRVWQDIRKHYTPRAS